MTVPPSRGGIGNSPGRTCYRHLALSPADIHEAGGERRIGDTLCINPGSEANAGILRGYLVDIGERGVELSQRVEG